MVLVQKSEGGGLGIGSVAGLGGMMSGRGTANLLTRTTAILAGAFMLTSLVLAIMAGGQNRPRSIIDQMPPQQSAPAERRRQRRRRLRRLRFLSSTGAQDQVVGRRRIGRLSHFRHD